MGAAAAGRGWSGRTCRLAEIFSRARQNDLETMDHGAENVFPIDAKDLGLQTGGGGLVNEVLVHGAIEGLLADDDDEFLSGKRCKVMGGIFFAPCFRVGAENAEVDVEALPFGKPLFAGEIEQTDDGGNEGDRGRMAFCKVHCTKTTHGPAGDSPAGGQMADRIALLDLTDDLKQHGIKVCTGEARVDPPAVFGVREHDEVRLRLKQGEGFRIFDERAVVAAEAVQNQEDRVSTGRRRLFRQHDGKDRRTAQCGGVEGDVLSSAGGLLRAKLGGEEKRGGEQESCPGRWTRGTGCRS